MASRLILVVAIMAMVMATIPFCLSFSIFGFDPFQMVSKFIGEKMNPETPIPLPSPPTLQIPSLEEAEYYAHVASATYCTESQLQEWSCPECKRAGAELKTIKVLTSWFYGTQGVIVHNEAKGELILAFRGSVNAMNYIQDFIASEKVINPYANADEAAGHPGIELHKGFLASADSLYDDVLPVVKEFYAKNPGILITITGHSLGASMASLTYFKLKHEIPQANYALFTYGQPRTGNAAWADWMNSQTIKLARVVNEGDIIPHIFFASMGNFHHQTEFWTHDGKTQVCTTEFYEDPNCSDSVPVEKMSSQDHLLYLGTVQGSCATE